MKTIFEDLQEINQFTQQINTAKDRTNAIVSEFNKLPLNKITTKEQLQQLIADLPGCMESMIPAETVKTFAMLKPHKIVELLDIDTSEVRRLIKDPYIGFVSEFLDVSKSSKSGFEVDPKKLDKRLDSFRIYANTEKEIQIAADYQALIDAAKKLTKYMSQGRFANTPPAQLWLTFRNDQFEIRPGFYSDLVRSTQ